VHLGDAPVSPATKRTLPPLPGHGHTLTELRDWLTTALAPPPGYLVTAFERAGRLRPDPCTLTLDAPGGGRVTYRWSEQRELWSASGLRASVYAQCDGLLRVPPLSKAELEDVWAALCMLAQVLVDQDDRDETREWLGGFLAVAEVLNGVTLAPTGRADALAALRGRGQFTRRAAMEMGDPTVDPRALLRPVVLIDSADAARWVRAGELATYLRHVVGVTIAQTTLDARVGEIGGKRERMERRTGGTRHPAIVLYRLPEDDGEEPDGADEARERGE
jgi:hypothetical protein